MFSVLHTPLQYIAWHDDDIHLEHYANNGIIFTSPYYVFQFVSKVSFYYGTSFLHAYLRKHCCTRSEFAVEWTPAQQLDHPVDESTPCRSMIMHHFWQVLKQSFLFVNIHQESRELTLQSIAVIFKTDRIPTCGRHDTCILCMQNRSHCNSATVSKIYFQITKKITNVVPCNANDNS